MLLGAVVRRGHGATLPAAATRVRAASDRSARTLAVVNAAIAVYAVGSVGLVLTHRVGLTAEHAILLVLLAAGFVPRLRGLSRAFVPFLFVAVMFEDLGSLQPLVAGAVHSAGPAVFERALFGGVNAAVWLQQHLGGLHGAQWWQLPLVAEYLSHFVAPILAGGYLYWRFRSRFGDYVAAYSLVMAAGFAVYLVYPEMPPWLAAQHGLLQPLNRLVVSTLSHLPGIGRLYAGADLFPDGAMPSLHVAVPMVIALSLIAARGTGRARWLWLLYPLTMAFAVVDLGEHYVADAVAGLAFGAGCFGVVGAVPALGRAVHRATWQHGYASTSARRKRAPEAMIAAPAKPAASRSAVDSVAP